MYEILISLESLNFVLNGLYYLQNKQWLLTEALPTNPKIDTNNDGKFTFKAQYKIKDKKSLLRLLRQHDLKGLGGILLEDIQESLPHSEKHLKVITLIFIIIIIILS